jgi:replication-associated recombination protein RarA
MNPIEYKPTRIRDFVGPAQDVARTLGRIAKRSLSNSAPIKILILGEPGVGKSALADFLLDQLKVSKWSITKLSGAQVRLEEIEEWAARLCYRDLFSNYKFLRIEEMDRASHTARARLLTVLDDLPNHVGIICTSNKEISEIEPRFPSRFQNFIVKPPASEQIKQLISRWPLREQDLNRISEFACGNVRRALFDAQTELDAKNMRIAA